MQSNPRILVNVLVILVKILVNLLVKLTRTNPKGGCHGRLDTTPDFILAEYDLDLRVNGWPQGPWPPLLGGGIQSGRGYAGEYSPTIPQGRSSQMAPQILGDH